MKFSIDDLKRCANTNYVFAYVRMCNLKQIGSKTSSRAVYAIDNERVIKIAKPGDGKQFSSRGFKQNIVEHKRSKVLLSKGLPIAQAYELGYKGAWLISERCKPFRNEKSFIKATGDERNRDAYSIVSYDDILTSPFIETCRAFKREGLYASEFIYFEQWGLNKRNELVLLDYGV